MTLVRNGSGTDPHVPTTRKRKDHHNFRGSRTVAIGTVGSRPQLPDRCVVRYIMADGRSIGTTKHHCFRVFVRSSPKEFFRTAVAKRDAVKGVAIERFYVMCTQERALRFESVFIQAVPKACPGIESFSLV
jgi:hypothetical protein